MTNLSDKKVIFPFAPLPLPGESVASWVIRLSASHDYDFLTIKKLANVKLSHKDWDEGLTEQDTHQLLETAGFEYEEFFCATIDPLFLRQNCVQLVPRYMDGHPNYAFCSACFKEDREPYLRWRWRYHNFRNCTIHNRPLRTSCQHCNSPLVTSTSLLRYESRSVFTPNLAFCKNCGQPLDQDALDCGRGGKASNPSLGIKVPEINPNDGQSIIRWLWIAKKRKAPWRLKFGLADEPNPYCEPRKIGLEHYRHLDVYARAKVAKALRIYHAEKLRQKAEDRLAVQIGESVE
jgi:RNase P subunit RPR2